MQTKSFMDGFIKILKICSRNKFFHIQNLNNFSSPIHYGPLGSLLRQNIKREWLFAIMHNPDVFIFPLEISSRKMSNQLHFLPDIETSFILPEVFENYFNMLPAFGSSVPFGFVAYGSNLALDQNISHESSLCNNPFLREIEQRHWLCVAFFCAQKKSSDWFNYWSRYRYIWWRKFSNLPSEFFMSDVMETITGDQQISLLMEFPWGKEKLETITVHSSDIFKKCCESLNLGNDQKANISTIITCKTELNLATFAYLNNSFAEKWRDGEIRNVFQLHVKLAPYKTSINLHDDGCDTKKLNNVAMHLEKQLKISQIPIFPCFGTSMENDTSQLYKLDEMGIPYVIILNERGLHSGIAYLRNRDTTLEEEVHIADLTQKILKYLQVKFPETN